MVLGNPPFLFGENRDQRIKAFLQAVFRLAHGQYDTAWLFIEQGLNLIHSKGRLAMIVPDTLLARDDTQKTRELLLQNGLEVIIHCGTAFKAQVSTIIFVISKGSSSRDVVSGVFKGTALQAKHICHKEHFLTDPKHRLLIHMPDEEARIFSRIERECHPLREFAKVSREEEIGKKDVHSQGPLPILAGEDISRYCITPPSRFLLTQQKDDLYYQAPKIVMMKTGYRCVAGLDTTGYVTMQSVYNLHLTSKRITYETLLAILNSQFIQCYIYKTFTSYKNIFPQLNQSTILAIPIPHHTSDVQGELLPLVQDIQCLHKKLRSTKNTQEEGSLRTQIHLIERNIDAFIYRLYGLKQEEITAITRNIQEKFLLS